MLFKKLCCRGSYYFAIVVANDERSHESLERAREVDELNEIDKLYEMVRDVLRRHAKVLEVPKALPPLRPFNHLIALVVERKLVNIPPYWYAHFQKGEIEKQVEEMLKNGLNMLSSSLISSPMLFVKKKDRTWRFYIYYRSLNKATVKERFSNSKIMRC